MDRLSFANMRPMRVTMALWLCGQAVEEIDDCDSPYWIRVQQRAWGGNSGPSVLSADDVDNLANEETEWPGENAGCQLGRLWLSVWQLVHLGTEDRAFHLGQRFGVAFYTHVWQPAIAWPIFSALAALRQKVHSDLEQNTQLYPRNRCDNIETLSRDLITPASAFRDALAGSDFNNVSFPSLAAELLSLAGQSNICPFAVCAAFWALALSLMPLFNGNSDPVRHLFELGENAAKAWESQKMPFLELLTTEWSLWHMMAHVQMLSRGHASLPLRAAVPKLGTTSSTSRALLTDPLNPTCSRPDLARLAEGLENQRVEAVVVYGRRERVEILHRYLWRNRRENGGVLDRVNFVVLAAMHEDLVFLDRLVAEHSPFYAIPAVTGRRLSKMYSVCTDPQTVYVKIDDDTVYISDAAIPEMVRERLRSRCAPVSANVINHAILSAVHQDIGAVRTFYPAEEAEVVDGTDPAIRPWLRADEEMPLMPIQKHAQSECVWKRWECAAWMHESFLSRLQDGTECAYDFGWHDFHSHGHGNYKGDRFVPLPYSRWSINMIAFMAEDLRQVSLPDLAEDDESELSYMVPYRMGKHSCAVGRAIVAHFSYSKQDEGLIANTDLLERYKNMSLSV